MFETVAPDAFARRDRHILYESLPVSIGLHAVAIGAVAIGIAAHVTLPVQPPKLVLGYVAAELTEPVPPPPPPPAAAPPAGAPKDQPKLETLAPIALAPMDLAPSVIPDEVNEMPLPSPIRLVSASVDKFVPGAGVAGGVAGGMRGGVSDGVAGGSSDGGVSGGMLGGDGRVHFERDARLPLFIEARPYPDYPDKCINAREEGTVVVKYIIAKDGHVSDVSILQRGSRKEFDESALEAVRKWRFRPLIVDGEAMEVVHELTVYFRLY